MITILTKTFLHKAFLNYIIQDKDLMQFGSYLKLRLSKIYIIVSVQNPLISQTFKFSNKCGQQKPSIVILQYIIQYAILPILETYVSRFADIKEYSILINKPVPIPAQSSKPCNVAGRKTAM